METTTTTLVISLAGALIGNMMFFALTVAPTVFSALTSAQAGRFLRAFFPVYYVWGLGLALLGAAIAMSSNAAVSVALLLVALLFVFARQVLMPRINHARDEQLRGLPGAASRFQQLHLWSVMINGFQLLVLLTAITLMVWTP